KKGFDDSFFLHNYMDFIVAFVELLLLMFIIRSIINKRNMPYEIKILKYSIVGSIILGIIGTLLITPQFIGKFLLALILISLVARIAS
ncbi:hypothetical protein, partial [Phascolarctobacterium sp.]|uniref:hypothetical protein n=1 Tax=Phascolarctobacterium sp. TaxID=2049039 RepID=UPI003076F2D4